MLNFLFDYDKKVRCWNCKWEGILKETNEQEVNSPRSAWMALAGREGWEWFCPECGAMVDNHYTKMS